MREATQQLGIPESHLDVHDFEVRTFPDRRQDILDPVVVGEDTVTGYVLGEADRAGIEILDDVDVVNVVDAHLAYFEAIGAVGPPADL